MLHPGPNVIGASTNSRPVVGGGEDDVSIHRDGSAQALRATETLHEQGSDDEGDDGSSHRDGSARALRATETFHEQGDDDGDDHREGSARALPTRI